MKKIAVFGEGHTEFWFIERLLQEWIGYGKIHFKLAKQHGGAYSTFRTTGAPEDACEIQVLLVNCDGDGSVKSFIVERQHELANQGYTHAVGLLDLHPKPLEALERFQEGLMKGLENAPLKIEIVVSIREVEAWFLNEHTHYLRMDGRLTNEAIVTATGFDPIHQDAEFTVHHPATLLDQIYQIAALRYKKKESEVMAVLANLDYSEIFLSIRQRSTSLDQFISALEASFADPAAEAA
jgi:hypothetical protein